MASALHPPTFLPYLNSQFIRMASLPVTPVRPWYHGDMGTIVRIKRHLDSDTVHLPEAHGLVGRDVEIVIREIGADEVATAREALRGSVLRYEDPFEPVAEDDWEALG